MLGREFASCWDKIGRAHEHIHFLKAKLKEWAETNPYTAIKKSDMYGSRHSVFVNIRNKPPVERWSLIAGDVVHNLRSALDHLVYAIAAHESKQAIPPQWKKIQFPIVSDPAKYAENRTRCKIDTLSTAVQDAIKLVQPHNRPHAEVPPLLSLLGDFDDADKHRLLNVVMSNVSQGKFQIKLAPGARIVANGSHVSGIEDGTEIAWFTIDPPDFNLEYYHEAMIVVSIVHEAGPNGRNFTELAAMLDWLKGEVIFIVDTVGAAIV